MMKYVKRQLNDNEKKFLLYKPGYNDVFVLENSILNHLMAMRQTHFDKKKQNIQFNYLGLLMGTVS